MKSYKKFLLYCNYHAEQITEKTDLTLTPDKFNFKNALYFIKIRSATPIEEF